MKIDRRRFGATLLAGSSALLASCGGEDRRTAVDHENLARQRREEEDAAGHGLYGRHRYAGYRDLARLPWYELDAEGRLVCVDPSIPEGIDVHAHLGMSLLFAPDIDLGARTARVEYMLDCDSRHPALPFDLDVYANANFDEKELRELQWGVVRQATLGSERAKTHTLPNLLAEMNDCRISQSCLLPIAFGLPFGDSLTEKWDRCRGKLTGLHSVHSWRVGPSPRPRCPYTTPGICQARMPHRQASPGSTEVLCRPARSDGYLRSLRPIGTRRFLPCRPGRNRTPNGAAI